MEWITDPNAWIALTTLTVLELVLGIDNIVFITILAWPASCRNPNGTWHGRWALRSRW